VAAPEWLLAPLRERAAQKTAAAAAAAPVEPVDLAAVPDQLRQLLGRIIHKGDGDRSAHLYAITAEARRAGYTQGEALTLVTPWCEATGKFTERAGRIAADVARSWGKLEAEDARLRFTPPAAPAGAQFQQPASPGSAAAAPAAAADRDRGPAGPSDRASHFAG
jgi:hypothetical protein